MYRSGFKRIGASSFINAPTLTIDWICEKYQTIPDLVKLDIEGAEHQALLGSTQCARQNRSRFLVEMHSNLDLSMSVNVQNVLQWCQEVGYNAWYMAEEAVLERPEAIQDRSRCHLLLQSANWPYPAFLKGIEERAELDGVSLSQPESQIQ